MGTEGTHRYCGLMVEFQFATFFLLHKYLWLDGLVVDVKIHKVEKGTVLWLLRTSTDRVSGLVVEL